VILGSPSDQSQLGLVNLGWPKMRKGIGLALAMAVAGMLVLPAPVGAAATDAHAVRPAGHLNVLGFGSHAGHSTHPTRMVAHNPTADLAAHIAAKRRAAAALRSPAGAVTATTGAASTSINLNQPGLGTGDDGFCCTPPDPTGAIGPNYYIEMVNSLVGVYSRADLRLVGSTDLGSFTAAPSGLTLSDPQIQWDFTANRWFYLAVAFQIPGNNYLVWGWSKTSDPSDLANGWCRFGVFTGDSLNDFPKLGHDDNYLLFGSNVYDDHDLNTELTANVWAYRKPSSGDTSCAGTGVITYFADAAHVLFNADGTPADTPIPANTTESSTGGYIVAAHSAVFPASLAGPKNKLMVWHMTMQSGSPVLVADGDIAVNSYNVPADALQPGPALDTLDGQLTQAVARQDPDAGAVAIWTQHTVAGPGGRSAVDWYELLPATLSVRQQGEVSSATNFIFNAAISTSTNGNDAVVEYNSASAVQTPYIAAQSRTGSTPLGAMDAGETVLASSTDVDNDFSCAPCRWGDYSGATPDPSNPGVVWGSNMVNGQGILGLPQWTTQNFALSTGGAAPPPDFSMGVSPANQSVTAGGSTSYTVTITPSGGFVGSVNLAVSGLPSGASGSFDINPATTSSTLTVATTTGVAAGSYTFTVTGSSGSLSHSANATLIVNVPNPPDFSLSASPSSRTVGQGVLATSYAVTITQLNGFNGSVDLTVAGLPVGATGSLSPTPAATASTLNVTIDATTPQGSYVLTITGASGSLSHSTTVTLVVVGDFGLSATPTSSSISRGGTATYTITVIAMNGFSGPVTLSATNLPTKASASFSPNPVASSSTLSLRTNRGQTPAGSYTIVITGTSGGVTHSITVTLTVS
jgi:hypothetical protein